MLYHEAPFRKALYINKAINSMLIHNTEKVIPVYTNLTDHYYKHDEKVKINQQFYTALFTLKKHYFCRMWRNGRNEL